MGNPLIKQPEKQFLTLGQGFSTSAVLTFWAKMIAGVGKGAKGCPVHSYCRMFTSIPDLYPNRCQQQNLNHHQLTTKTVSRQSQMSPGRQNRPWVENQCLKHLFANDLLLLAIQEHPSWSVLDTTTTSSSGAPVSSSMHFSSSLICFLFFKEVTMVSYSYIYKDPVLGGFSRDYILLF